MLIDCELMGSGRRLELCVPDVGQAWSFYRDVMGAREVSRSERRTGGPTAIGFIIGKTSFTMGSQDYAGSADGRPTLSLLAVDRGVTFAAIVLHVQDQATAARHAIDAGSRRASAAASGTPTHRGRPVEVIIDPFGNSWAFAKSSEDRRYSGRPRDEGNDTGALGFELRCGAAAVRSVLTEILRLRCSGLASSATQRRRRVRPYSTVLSMSRPTRYHGQTQNPPNQPREEEPNGDLHPCHGRHE